MAPPLIDRIQQNLQPVVTTTWVDVPSFVLTATSPDNGFGPPQPTHAVTFSAGVEGGSLNPATSPFVPAGPGRELVFSATAPGGPLVVVPDVAPITPSYLADTFVVESAGAQASPLPPTPPDIPAVPGDTLAVEVASPAPPNPATSQVDTIVTPDAFTVVGEVSAPNPFTSGPEAFVPIVEGPFVFTFSAGPTGGEFPGPGPIVVPPPLVVTSVMDVTSGLGSLVSAVVAAAIALTPVSQVSLAYANSIEVRVEEPTQPFPQRPIDWLWEVNIKWEAEPPPIEVTIEEPLLPLTGIWADGQPPEIWDALFVPAISSGVPPPQPEPPPPPPPPRPSGGGGGPNPIGGGGYCPPCPPCPPTPEELERLRMLGFFQYMPDPPGGGGASESPESMVPSGTPQSLIDDFLAWIKVPANRAQVKKAVRWGLGAWAVYKRLKK